MSTASAATPAAVAVAAPPAAPAATTTTPAPINTSSSILEKHPRLMDELPKHAKPAALANKVLAYGTAGFRDNADILGSTFHRMGMLAVLRSKKEHKITGLMVTASHNAAPDNGVKLVDPDGGMLSQSWEKYAQQLANAPTEKVVEALDSIVRAEKIDLDQPGNIFIAKDTRVSSEHLSELAREGALLVGGNVLDFGLQTTPQLHHYVRMWNFEQYNKGDWASETGYYNMLVDAFKQLTSGVDPKTAYANGGAHAYLKAKHIPIGLAKTGVKYCHHKAMEFDIGIYFEANGHGTVMVKDHVIDRLQKLETAVDDPKKKAAVSQILAAYQLINQAVGDALSDLLFVEVLLLQQNWTIQHWNAIYNDLPSRQTKVKIADRALVKTTDDETACLAPEALKDAVDALVAAAGPRARAFVRPSGTEDAVRVYAEAQTEAAANDLALRVAQAVHAHAAGVGDAPTAFVA
ncbi:hypothetical protein DYB37_008906 [Aphanomyces astaci]|uniref:Phosphoacetylglucosamine mutase n=1 Tax=Aphanomyces astaci TaxID=112090 RepID=A0A3R7AYS8_APHAT|nr:hypothetical protein DYB37_008906 [Aphanomyces astaci]